MKSNSGNDLLYAGVYLIAQADTQLQTVKLHEAIKQLEALIYTREHIPF